MRASRRHRLLLAVPVLHLWQRGEWRRGEEEERRGGEEEEPQEADHMKIDQEEPCRGVSARTCLSFLICSQHPEIQGHTHTHAHQMANRVAANLCAAHISALGIKKNERKAFEDFAVLSPSRFDCGRS